ncbi:MAG: DegV family protein [Lachnospiraceae bacterium]|nr:DegV family protein [Lachnospiraceae bacterium]
MSNFVITTDSTCDLPYSFIKEHGVVIQPLEYSDGKDTFQDGPTTDLKAFYSNMRNGVVYKTNASNPQGVSTTFRKILDEGKDILHIGFSSGLSSSFSNTLLAVSELEEAYPDRRIIAIDSLAASMGQGLIVYYACKLKEEGASLDDVADWVRQNRLHACHQFTVDDLKYLMRGGRVSKVSYVLGTLINIKPVLHVDDEGHLIPLSKVRGRKKSLITLVDNMEQTMGSYRDRNEIVLISHCDCLEDAQFVGNLITERFGITNIVYNYINTVIGSHSGPGTVALFFLGETR